MSGTPFLNVNNIHVHFVIPEDQKNMTDVVRGEKQYQDVRYIIYILHYNVLLKMYMLMQIYILDLHT